MMILVRFGPAAVLGTAGYAKLADPQAARRAVAGAGVPRRAIGPIAVTLSLAELAVAALLLLGPRRLSALATVILIALLNTGLGVRVLRGERGACKCFGGRSAGPIGWFTLARNALLTSATLALWWSTVALSGR